MFEDPPAGSLYFSSCSLCKKVTSDHWSPYATLDFYYWIWLFPLLSLIHIILQTLELMSKTDFMSKLFGPLVTLLEFVLGPKITNDASDNDQNDENEIILI